MNLYVCLCFLQTFDNAANQHNQLCLLFLYAGLFKFFWKILLRYRHFAGCNMHHGWVIGHGLYSSCHLTITLLKPNWELIILGVITRIIYVYGKS